MNTEEIHQELLKWKPAALGVFPCNELPQKINAGEGLLVNSAPSGTEGQHWLAIFRDDKDDVLEIFDTYGLPLDTYPLLKETLLRMETNRNTLVRRNEGQLQSDQSDGCGLYCLLFLLLRINNMATMEQIISDVFSNDLKLNDCIALYWLIEKFNTSSKSFVNVLSTKKCK